MTQEYDPVKKQNNENEDSEFRRIQNENEWRETQLKKVRNLEPTKSKQA